MVVAQPAQLGEVAVGGREHAAGALHRLGDHGGDLVAALGHQHGQRLGVVARHLDDVGHERPPALPVRRDALGAGAAEVGAVVAAVAADDQRPLRVAGQPLGQPGQLHRRVDGLRARAAEEHAGVGRSASGRPAGRPARRPGRWRTGRSTSRRRSCAAGAATASAISARPWPAAQYHRLAMASTYSLPSVSQTSAPSPRAIVGERRSRVGLAKGCRNGGQIGHRPTVRDGARTPLPR